jgi:hypothetical protein
MACGTHGRGEKSVQGFGGKASRKVTENLDVDERTGSEWIPGRLAVAVEWIRLAQDRKWCRALVNTALNLWVLEQWSCYKKF